MRRTLLLGLSVFASLTLNSALARAADVHTDLIHTLKVNKPAHHPGGGAALLLSHGGAIQSVPEVFIVYRGQP